MPLSQSYSPTFAVWIEIYSSSGSEPHRVLASIALDLQSADAIAASMEELQGVSRVSRQSLNGCWQTEYQVAVNWAPSDMSAALAFEFQQFGIPAEKIHVEVV
jgi:hypothetical protein